MIVLLAAAVYSKKKKKKSPKGRENNGSWKNARDPVRRGLGRDKGGKKKKKHVLTS